MNTSNRLGLKPHHFRSLLAFLGLYLPDAEIWAYGSRVQGNYWEASDLELVVRNPQNLEVPQGESLNRLITALMHSNIPIRVQVHDWAYLPDAFRKEIEKGYSIVQHKKQ